MSKPAGKRPRSAAASVASPVYSTPESPSLLPSIQKLFDNQLEKLNERLYNLELKITSEIRLVEVKVTELTKTVSFNSENLESIKKKVIPTIQGKLEEDENLFHNELDRLNLYICRGNLVFIGIPETSEVESTATTLKKFFSEKLNLSAEVAENIEFQRAHRIPATARPRPIKARFLRYPDRELILRNAKLLKGSNTYITEDLPRRIRLERKAQMEALKVARREGKLAYFSRTEPWKLFVDKVYLPKTDQPRFLESHRRMDTQNAQK